MMTMPPGVVTAADLHAHYMAVRKRIMRAHLRLTPRPGIGPEYCQPGIETTISRPAPELYQFDNYTKAIKTKLAPPLPLPFMVISPWRRATLRDIIRTVAQHYGTTITELSSGKMRPANLIRARQIIYYLAHEGGHSYAAIGRRLKQCDHTSSLHGYRKTVRMLKTDDRLAAEISEIKSKLKLEAR